MAPTSAGLERGEPQDWWKRPIQTRSRRRSRNRWILLIGIVAASTIVLIVVSGQGSVTSRLSDSSSRWTLGSLIGSMSAQSSLTQSSRHLLPKRPQPLKSQDPFLQDNAKYLEAWVARGEVLPGLDLSGEAYIDGLWFWVNGSDPRHAAARSFYAQDPHRIDVGEGIVRHPHGHKVMQASRPQTAADSSGLQNVESRFREHDELRYSLRSAKAALGDYLRTSHVVSTDFWPSGRSEAEAGVGTVEDVAHKRIIQLERIGHSDVFSVEDGLLRVGQLPQWLNVSTPGVSVGAEATRVPKPNASYPDLAMHHDWSVFADLRSAHPISQVLSNAATDDQLLQRKLRALPTFNSLAAEASLGLNVPGLAENFFYSNDDFYLGAELRPSDFHSPLYGPIMHINKNWAIQPVEHPPFDTGELPSMRVTAWLLGQRFGSRGRQYILHVHKTHSRPLLAESRMIWGDDFAKTAGRRFRGDGRGANSHMISYHMIIERHREALLWSYFVSKLDKDGDGHYSESELIAAWSELGYSTRELSEHRLWQMPNRNIPHPVRETLLNSTIAQSHRNAKWPLPAASDFKFTSQDGYALAEIRHDKIGDNEWPVFHTEPGAAVHDVQSPSAIMSWKACWKFTKTHDPVALFKYMAFENPSCGDFLITYLVQRQGKRGLDIFLPTADAAFPEVETEVDPEETTPHLPLNPRWDDCDFDLDSVARNTGWAGMSRRLFSMRLIQRYAYTVAGAPAYFQMLKTPSQAKMEFDSLRRRKGKLAFIGLNDDVEEIGKEKTFSMMQDWLEDFWPSETTALPFEILEEEEEEYSDSA